jgi:hypothetical protein
MTEPTLQPFGSALPTPQPGGALENHPAQAASPARPIKPRTNPFLTRGSLLLTGMCVVGFVSLYVLGHRAGPNAALGQQSLVYAKVDAALDKMGAQLDSADLHKRTDAKAIIDDFYTAATQRQVDRNLLQRNPFVFKKRAPEPAIVVETPRDTDPKDQVPAELKAAMAAIKELQLQSVLVGGRQPAALISNNLVMQGQLIKGWTVTKIEAGQVELTWKDQKQVLALPK